MLCTGGGKNTRTARTPVAAAVAGCAAVNRGGNEGVCSRITEKSSCKEPPGPEDLVECSEIDRKDSMNHCVPNWEMENGMMPSPEFLPMAKSNWDTAQQKRSFLPEHEIEELLWENGTVVNKVIKRPLPNQLCKILQNDDAVLPGKPSIPGKDNILESVVHDMAATNASSSIHEDEMASWLHYPLDDSLEKEYCSDFFGGMPSTNVHMLRDSVGAQVNHVPTERVSNLQVQKGSCLPNDNNSLPWTGVFASMANTANTAGSSITGKDSGPKAVNSDKAMALGAGRASGLISQPGANAFAKVRTTTQLPVSKWHTNVQPSCNSEDSQSPCQKSATHSVSLLAMPPPKTQAPDLGSVKADKVRLVNFSHFSRPAATMKANLQSIGSVSGLSTIGISNRLDKFREDGNASAETSVIESTTSDMTTIASSSATNNQIQDIGHCQTCQNPPQRKSTDVAIAACSEDITASSAKAPESVSCQTLNVGRNLASGGVEKCGDAGDVPEPTITSSSGGSGNSAGRMGKETTHTSKRKSRDVDESECQSEDIEYESVDTKKQVPPRTTSKRSRAAEVHNQSERRRRDRINEKMRALQELIPHCNKSDKASMLDEAIEYLKTLQLQVQIMSMGGGMGLSPMMYTGGMQPFQVPQMAHLAPMGMGIGMGMGYSMGMLDMGATSGRPVMPLPAMHVSPLPASTICPAPMPLSGMPGPSFPIPRIPVSGIQVSGLPVSTLPVSGFSGTAQPVLVSTSASTSTDLQDQTQNTNVIDPYKFYLSRQQMQLAPQAMNGNLYSGPLAPSTPQNPTQSSGRVIPNAESSGRVIPNAEPRTGNQGTAG